MDQHFNLEYFTTFDTNEYELLVSFIRIKQLNAYAKVFVNIKQVSGKNQLAPDCLTLAGAIIRQDIKSAERLGYHCGMQAWPVVKQMIDEGNLKLKMPATDFEVAFGDGATHAKQKLGHA